MVSTELVVGAPVRRRAGLAIITALGLAAAVAAVTVVGKEIPTLNHSQPWQDDPYDVPVSLDFVVLPLLVALGALRVGLCRRSGPLPTRRLVDLLRICDVALGASLATELAEWVAVALGRHRAAWTAVTTWQVAALAVLSVATVGSWVLVRRAARAVSRTATAADQPDWLADTTALGLRVARLLGRAPRWELAVLWVDAAVVGRVRAHPVAAAGLLATILALPFVAAKIVLEGYSAPLVLLIFVFLVGSLFVFVVLVGAFLRVIAPRPGRPAAWLSTTILACTAGAVAFAFHDSLLTEQTVTGLGALYFGAAGTAGVLGLALQAGWRLSRARADRRR